MLRVQLLNKQRAEDDYASSRISIDKRQVPWLLSPAERKALPIGVLRKLRQLEREEERARKQLPGSISKLVKGYELRMCRFEVRGHNHYKALCSCNPQAQGFIGVTCGRSLSVVESLRLRAYPCSSSPPVLPRSWYLA